MTRHKVRLWELLLHWGARFLCFRDTEALVGGHKATNALFYPIPWNLRCFSLFSPPLIETECVHPSDNMLKENIRDTELVIFNWRKTKVLLLNASHLFPKCWLLPPFFLLQTACCFIFRHEISYWNQLWVYNVCWAPTTDKKLLLRRLSR